MDILKISPHKLVSLLGAIWGVGVVSADISKVEVIYVDQFAFLDPLLDSEGVALTAGTEVNGDGAIFQVGYFEGVSHLLDPGAYGESEWERFTPLTGMGSPNAERHPTTIGDVDSHAAGPFGYLFFPAPVAIELNPVFDIGMPETNNPSRLGVRFYDGTTLEESRAYNIVTSNDSRWILLEPEPTPAVNAVLNLDEHPLVWASGVDGAFQTSLHLPEPNILWLVAVCGLFLPRRRSGS
jgi:hypothetical protein